MNNVPRYSNTRADEERFVVRIMALGMVMVLLAIVAAVMGCGCVQRYNIVEVYGNAPLTISVNADVDHANQLTPKVSLK